MNLAQADQIAGKVRDQLAPYCDRIEIAGSIRRRKAEPGDIEIVCIPRTRAGGLFGSIVETDPDFCRIVNAWDKVKGEPTGKYTQRLLPGGVKLDLFMAHAGNWGLIFAIRTGSASFSHTVLARGWTAKGYKSVGGMLTRDGEEIPVREERDLFDLIGVPWVEPEGR